MIFDHILSVKTFADFIDKWSAGETRTNSHEFHAKNVFEFFIGHWSGVSDNGMFACRINRNSVEVVQAQYRSNINNQTASSTFRDAHVVECNLGTIDHTNYIHTHRFFCTRLVEYSSSIDDSIDTPESIDHQLKCFLKILLVTYINRHENDFVVRKLLRKHFHYISGIVQIKNGQTLFEKIIFGENLEYSEFCRTNAESHIDAFIQ